MNLVYVFTGGKGTRHYGELALSAATARKFFAGKILVITDKSSAECVHDLMSSRLIDEAIIVDVKNSPQAQASRKIKTSIAEYVDPPFLYLDTDTLFRRPVSASDFGPGAIQFAFNHSADDIADQRHDNDRKIFQRLGWESPSIGHFNGGVFYLGTKDVALRFCREWRKSWELSVARTGRHYDQPSLNETLRRFEQELQPLPHAMNAQVFMAPWAERGAKIIHYYGTPAFRSKIWTATPISLIAESDPALAYELIESAPKSIFQFEQAIDRWAFEGLSYLQRRSPHLRELAVGKKAGDIMKGIARQRWSKVRFPSYFE